jgi:hypothetical protein
VVVTQVLGLISHRKVKIVAAYIRDEVFVVDETIRLGTVVDTALRLTTRFLVFGFNFTFGI